MALTSPGVQINVIDESQYLPAAAGPRPLIIVASAQDKTDGAGTGTASGTLKANAEKVQLVTSQRELVSLFGVPKFYTDNSGTALQGYELNEYGLLAAYSFLGVASSVYIARADLDLNQLAGSGTAPTGTVATGSYWLDQASTSWGILEWNAEDQAFRSIAPRLITSSANISSGAPKTSFGVIGSYAITASTNTMKAWYKNTSNAWVQLGSSAWAKSFATLTTSAVSGSLTAANVLVINSQSIAVPASASNTMSGLAAAINANSTLSANMTASVTNNAITIKSDVDVVIGTASTDTLVATLGLTEKTYYAPKLHQAKHTVAPGFKTGSNEPRPTGSIWFKTTSPNNGLKLSVKKINVAEEWKEIPCTAYDDNASAIVALSTDGEDPSTITTGALYLQYDVAGNNTWQTTIYEFMAGTPLQLDGTVANPTFVSGNTFTVTLPQTATTYTATLAGTDVDAFIAAFSAAGVPDMEAGENTDGTIFVRHTLGGDFKLNVGTGTPLTAAGLSTTLVTNWEELDYTPSVAEPRDNPAQGTLWYSTVVDEVDIMVHDGSDWSGYRNVYPTTDPAGPIVSASQPETQSDGTALVTNDLWIDTSDIEAYPLIKRYNSAGAWITVDNTDQTSEDGILFGDARNGELNSSGAFVSDNIADMLLSDYVDPDCPDPALYPKDMLLFNLRRSGYNVKEYQTDYLSADAYPTGNERTGGDLPVDPDRWVSYVGVDTTGAPYMGRKSVRRSIVQAMQAMVNSSDLLRQEQNDFDIIAAPSYAELLDEMVVLNTDRKNTAFILVDPPFRLAPSASAVKAWAINTNLAPTNGEQGLATLNEYAAVYYPNAFASELTGLDVAVPASHVMLRTIALNDQVSYPWFAPAGLRRGVVNNATSVGYIKDGEFVPVPLGQGVRDIMYENRVNPIVIQPTGGVVVFGQKTLNITSSAMDRVNVARLVVYIRRQLDRLVKPYLFEPNDKQTRNEVKAQVESFFSELVSLRGLYDFLVVCDDSNNTPERIDRNELHVDIAIKPVKAIEFIYIPIRIKNTGESLA